MGKCTDVFISNVPLQCMDLSFVACSCLSLANDGSREFLQYSLVIQPI